MRIVNVAHGSLYAYGAYAAATIGIAVAPISPWLTYPGLLLAAIGIGVVIGGLLERFLLRLVYGKRRGAPAPDHLRGVHDPRQPAAPDLGRAADLRRRAAAAPAQHHRARRRLHLLPDAAPAGRRDPDARRPALLPAPYARRRRHPGGHRGSRGGDRDRHRSAARVPDAPSSSARSSPRSAGRSPRRRPRSCPASAPT